MTIWCMAHPYLTFILAALLILTVEGQVSNFFRAKQNRMIVDAKLKGVDIREASK
jgi:hypothetical protein